MKLFKRQIYSNSCECRSAKEANKSDNPKRRLKVGRIHRVIGLSSLQMNLSQASTGYKNSKKNPGAEEKQSVSTEVFEIGENNRLIKQRLHKSKHCDCTATIDSEQPLNAFRSRAFFDLVEPGSIRLSAPIAFYQHFFDGVQHHSLTLLKRKILP